MNCVLYARVSTQEQAEADLSIPAQLQAMREYAQQRGWKVIEEFIESGVSARTTDRPSLQRMLSAARERHRDIGAVLVHKIDRLARNLADHATIRALLKRHRIRLASVVENMDDSVSGQLVENIMASLAEFYSANLSDEVKKGMRQMVIKGGWPHKPPRGYMVVRTKGTSDGLISIHPDDGPSVRLAFELYATGAYSVAALADRLASQGLTNHFGKPLAHAHLRRILENSFYIGQVRWHGCEYAGQHPPLISKELFARVQQVIQDRVSNPGPRGSVIPGFVLRGLAICSKCRGRMTCERHGKWKYYRCSRQTYRRDLCSARMCNVKAAHESVERICRSIRMSPELADQTASAAAAIIQDKLRLTQASQRAAMENRRQLTQREVSLAQQFTTGTITPAAYEEAVRQIQASREQAQWLDPSTAPIDATLMTDRVVRTLRLASSVWELYERVNQPRKAALLKAVFGNVILSEQGIIGYTLTPPFEAVVNRSDDASPDHLARTILEAAA